MENKRLAMWKDTRKVDAAIINRIYIEASQEMEVLSAL
jgi:hypothetical protein